MVAGAASSVLGAAQTLWYYSDATTSVALPAEPHVYRCVRAALGLLRFCMLHYAWKQALQGMVSLFVGHGTLSSFVLLLCPGRAWDASRHVLVFYMRPA